VLQNSFIVVILLQQQIAAAVLLVSLYWVSAVINGA
jgi:hypothetical protein